MGFLTDIDRQKREQALAREEVATQARLARDAAVAEKAREEAATALAAARKEVVDELFRDLRDNFIKGKDVVGTASVGRKAERPTPVSAFGRREPVTQNPVFAAMNVHDVDWEEKQRLRTEELAAIQSLVDEIDTDYVVFCDFKSEDMIDSKDGPIGSYVTGVIFSLRPKGSSS